MDEACSRAAAVRDRTGLIRVGAYLGALVFYAVSLEFLGFIVATALTITFILRVAERYPWRATLALTAGTIVGCQVLFVLWLGACCRPGRCGRTCSSNEAARAVTIER